MEEKEMIEARLELYLPNELSGYGIKYENYDKRVWRNGRILKFKRLKDICKFVDECPITIAEEGLKNAKSYGYLLELLKGCTVDEKRGQIKMHIGVYEQYDPDDDHWDSMLRFA
jgi:hypothetical protein